MFKLLLTVFLGVCVGAVVADLLFGPDQPATPDSGSQGQQWEPWRSWYASARRQSRRALAAITTWSVSAAQAIDRRARQAARWVVATLQLVPDTLRSMRARRQATAERNAAHARHVAHLETVAPPRRPLPPPVAPTAAPPLDPGSMGGVSGVSGGGAGGAGGGADGVRGMGGVGGMGGMGGVETNGAAGPNGDRAPNGADPLVPADPAPPRAEWPQPLPLLLPSAVDPTEPRRPVLGPPMDAPAAVGPPVPPSLRGQELVQTSEMPVPDAADVGSGSGPLGRPPWDALVRRPAPAEAPTPRRRGRGRRAARRDLLSSAPGERPPDPEWDEGTPGPLVVPMRVRARSAAVLLAMTTIFGVVTATAILVAVVMAVGALNRF